VLEHHRIALGVLLLLGASSFAVAQPTPPPSGGSSGSTYELGLGLGVTSVWMDSRAEVVSGRLFNVGIGGWISPRTALTLRIAGTSFSARGDEADVQIVSGLIGPSAQHIITDDVWIGFGAGLGVAASDGYGVPGFGLDLRAGYNFYHSSDGAFSLSLEVSPGFFGEGTITGFGLQIGWQHSVKAPPRSSAPTPPVADPALMARATLRDRAWELTKQAAAAAHAGSCTTVVPLAATVKQLDADLHAAVFLSDAAIARCLASSMAP